MKSVLFIALVLCVTALAEERPDVTAQRSAFLELESGAPFPMLSETVALFGPSEDEDTPAATPASSDSRSGQAFAPLPDGVFTTDLLDLKAGDGSTPEQKVWAALRIFAVRIFELDDREALLDAMTADFTSSMGTAERVVELLHEGGAHTASLSFDAATIIMEYGRALASPVRVKSAGGDVQVSITLWQEKGVWKVGELKVHQPGSDADVVRLPDVYNPDGAYEPVSESQY